MSSSPSGLGDGLREERLARPRLALHEERALEGERAVDGGLERLVGEVDGRAGETSNGANEELTSKGPESRVHRPVRASSFIRPAPQRASPRRLGDDIVVAERRTARERRCRRRTRRRLRSPASRAEFILSPSWVAQRQLDGHVAQGSPSGADLAVHVERHARGGHPASATRARHDEAGPNRRSLPGAGRCSRRRRRRGARAALTRRSGRPTGRRRRRGPCRPALGDACRRLVDGLGPALDTARRGRFDAPQTAVSRRHRPRRQVDALPEPPVVDLDPRVRLVLDEPRRDSEALRGDEERVRAMPANALLREGQVEVNASARPQGLRPSR